ncbi:hypothetical protein FSS13T_00570 [Flavobacterium saliperosum S13]|uniref:Transposase n=1 Tax=Flavobacterium saliperosum S13 TaxID=1341155 RepID=A0ABN0QKB8_9FLAO|nr:hypothetical protein FSS13T_00570 [Flavobacterium saliperosum S13]
MSLDLDLFNNQSKPHSNLRILKSQNTNYQNFITKKEAF